MVSRWGARGVFLLLFPMLVTGCSSHRIEEYNAFAIRCAKAELWQEASFRWKQVLEIDPNYAPAYNNLGVAYEALEKFDEALAAYDRAIALDPSNEVYRINRARCLRQKNRDLVGAKRDETKPSEDDGVKLLKN